VDAVKLASRRFINNQ